MAIQRQGVEIQSGLDGDLFFDAAQSIGELVIAGKSYGFEWTEAGLRDRERHCQAPCRREKPRRPDHGQGLGEQERHRDLGDYANQDAKSKGIKSWHYPLIPHDEVREATDMAGYTSDFTAEENHDIC